MHSNSTKCNNVSPLLFQMTQVGLVNENFAFSEQKSPPQFILSRRSVTCGFYVVPCLLSSVTCRKSRIVFCCLSNLNRLLPRSDPKFSRMNFFFPCHLWPQSCFFFSFVLQSLRLMVWALNYRAHERRTTNSRPSWSRCDSFFDINEHNSIYMFWLKYTLCDVFV